MVWKQFIVTEGMNLTTDKVEGLRRPKMFRCWKDSLRVAGLVGLYTVALFWSWMRR